jgi:hypothetical protein
MAFEIVGIVVVILVVVFAAMQIPSYIRYRRITRM